MAFTQQIPELGHPQGRGVTGGALNNLATKGGASGTGILKSPFP
jgi:hypothetical protein